RYKNSYAFRKVLCGRTVDFSFTIGDKFKLEQWFEALGWRDFTINAPYYIEIVKEFYGKLSNIRDSCSDTLELKTKINRVVIKFDDRVLGNILNVLTIGSNFFKTKKWPEDPELVQEDCLKVFYPNENIFGGMAKKPNILGAEHRLLHHITATQILPIGLGIKCLKTVEDLSIMGIGYQYLYIMWYIVNGKALNLPHLITKNMLRASFKVNGALPYGMVITKIISHFGIIVGNEVPSRIDVGDIYNASSLKRIGW
ncbi:LOW QUALITY PROTEIN: hypothetical protein CFOL_v3_19996, partial [Cephalotus follicularis]